MCKNIRCVFVNTVYITVYVRKIQEFDSGCDCDCVGGYSFCVQMQLTFIS